MKQDNKQRLFEVMQRLDKTFKPRLNEEFGGNTDDPTKEEMVGFLMQQFAGSEMEIENMQFDIEAAIYWFANHYHGGQNSNLYSVLSTSEFRPGPMHRGIEDEESETATMMYQDLVDKYGGQENSVDAGNTQWHGIEMNENDSWESLPPANQAHLVQQAKQMGITPQELFTQMQDEEREDEMRYKTKRGIAEKDDKWIQKAVDPEHKGYCTPMTKDTCTPKRKALAKRFKAGIEDESVSEGINYPAPEEYRSKVEKLKQTMDMLFSEEYFDVIDTLFRLLVTRDSGKIASLEENLSGRFDIQHGLTNDDTRDISINIVDKLVADGIIPDDMNTDNDTEFRTQDIIHEILNQVFNIQNQ